MDLYGKELDDAQMQAAIESNDNRLKAEDQAKANFQEAWTKLSEFGDIIVSESTVPEGMKKVLGYRHYMRSVVGYNRKYIKTHTVKESYITGYSGNIDDQGKISISADYSTRKYSVGDSTPEVYKGAVSATSDRFKVVTKGMKEQVLQWEGKLCANAALFLDARNPNKKVVTHRKMIFTWLMYCLLRLVYAVAGIIFLIFALGLLTEQITPSALNDANPWTFLFGGIYVEDYIVYSILGVMALLGVVILITGKRVWNYYIYNDKQNRQYSLPLIATVLGIVDALFCIIPIYFPDFAASSFMFILIVPVNVVSLAVLVICICSFIFGIKDIVTQKCLHDMEKRSEYRSNQLNKDIELLQKISAAEIKELPALSYRDVETFSDP